MKLLGARDTTKAGSPALRPVSLPLPPPALLTSTHGSPAVCASLLSVRCGPWGGRERVPSGGGGCAAHPDWQPCPGSSSTSPHPSDWISSLDFALLPTFPSPSPRGCLGIWESHPPTPTERGVGCFSPQAPAKPRQTLPWLGKASWRRLCGLVFQRQGGGGLWGVGHFWTVSWGEPGVWMKGRRLQ